MPRRHCQRLTIKSEPASIQNSTNQILSISQASKPRLRQGTVDVCGSIHAHKLPVFAPPQAAHRFLRSRRDGTSRATGAAPASFRLSALIALEASVTNR